MKIIFLLALLAIVGALALAGLAMLRDSHGNQTDISKGKRMMHALALRVGLSIALFVFILIAYMMGWIHPTGIPMGH
jgi:hypothetical protein